MRRTAAIACVLTLTGGVLLSRAAAAPVRTAAPGAAPDVAQRFLPWPPFVPMPIPRPPAVPLDGSAGPAAVDATLEQVLAAIQGRMDELRRWLDLVRQAVAGALTQIIAPLPAQMPVNVDPADIVAQIAQLPESWRAIVDAALAKLRARASPDDTVAVRHEADVSSSPELSREAGAIAAEDRQLTSDAVQQALAVQATDLIAAGAAHDLALPSAANAARATGDQLIAGASDLPSARAGIEVLVAGMGAGLRHQAALSTVLAARLTALIQQGAQVSAQIGALASDIGAMAARDAERDRRRLDGRLGVADAAREGATFLRRLLQGAGEPADEIRLDPLY